MGLLCLGPGFALGLTVPLSGTVEDPAGKPVEGASVWLVDSFRKDPGTEILIEAKTDAEGNSGSIGRTTSRAGSSTGRRLSGPTSGEPGGLRRVQEARALRHEPVRLVRSGRRPVLRARVLMPDGKPSPA